MGHDHIDHNRVAVLGRLLGMACINDMTTYLEFSVVDWFKQL